VDDNGVRHQEAGAAGGRAAGRLRRNRSGRPRRAAALASLVAAAALGLAACGPGASGPSGGGTSGSDEGGTASTKAGSGKLLEFARCMRAHGLGSFPDPVPAPGGGYSLHIRITPGSPLNPHSPRYRAAQAACKAFSPSGNLTPAQQVAANAKALKYSQCMRSHGIGSYPDPDGHGTIKVAAGPGIDPTSPRFQQAEQACQGLDNGFNMQTSNFPS
jgi:hypothetical protein